MPTTVVVVLSGYKKRVLDLHNYRNGLLPVSVQEKFSKERTTVKQSFIKKREFVVVEVDSNTTSANSRKSGPASSAKKVARCLTSTRF